MLYIIQLIASVIKFLFILFSLPRKSHGVIRGFFTFLFYSKFRFYKTKKLYVPENDCCVHLKMDNIKEVVVIWQNSIDCNDEFFVKNLYLIICLW